MSKFHSTLNETNITAIFNEIEKLIGKQIWEEIDAKTINPMIVKHFISLPVKTFKTTDYYLSINRFEQPYRGYSYLISLQTNPIRAYDYVIDNSLYDILFNPVTNEFFFYEKDSNFFCCTGDTVWFSTEIHAHSTSPENLPPYRLKVRKYMFTLVDYTTKTIIKRIFAFLSPIKCSLHDCVFLQFDDYTSNIITATGEPRFSQNLSFADKKVFGDSLIFIINDDEKYQVADLNTGIIYPDVYTMYNVNTRNKACAQKTDGSWVYIEKDYKITPVTITSKSCLYAKFAVSLSGARYNDYAYFIPVSSADLSLIKVIPDAGLQYIQFLYLPEFINIEPFDGTVHTNVRSEKDLEDAFGFSKLYIYEPFSSFNKPYEVINVSINNFTLVSYEEFRNQPNLFRLVNFGME